MATSIVRHMCARVFSSSGLTLDRSGDVLVALFGFSTTRLAYMIPGARWDYI